MSDSASAGMGMSISRSRGGADDPMAVGRLRSGILCGRVWRFCSWWGALGQRAPRRSEGRLKVRLCRKERLCKGWEFHSMPVGRRWALYSIYGVAS